MDVATRFDSMLSSSLERRASRAGGAPAVTKPIIAADSLGDLTLGLLLKVCTKPP